MSVTFHGTVLIEGVWHQAFRADDEPRFNISNSNAAALLDWLGLKYDREYLLGEYEPDVVIGHCLVALALGEIEDTGVPATNVNGRFIDCGREPGYFMSRTTMLLALAEYCKARGAMVGFA